METTQTHLRSNPSSAPARPTATHQHKQLWPAQLPKKTLSLPPCRGVWHLAAWFTPSHSPTPTACGEKPGSGVASFDRACFVARNESLRCRRGRTRVQGVLPGEQLPGGPRGQQGAAELPASPAGHSSPPGNAGFGPFSSPSCGSTTNPSGEERLHFHFVSPTGICHDTSTVPISPMGVWVGSICSGRGWKIPQKPLALAPQPLQHSTDLQPCGLW